MEKTDKKGLYVAPQTEVAGVIESELICTSIYVGIGDLSGGDSGVGIDDLSNGYDL